jgi:hypothetical protein
MPALLRLVFLSQALEHPIDFLVVTRVVGARSPVEFPAASAKVWQSQVQIVFCCPISKGLRVVALRGALQAMEQHQHGSIGPAGVLAVYVNKIAIGRGPAFALQGHDCTAAALGIKGRPDGLRMATR